ncbi:MAG: DEAD/DEAH box helicase [Myxococcota bacterium]
MQGLPSQFGAATRAWLKTQFDAPTPVQERGWPLLASGGHALLVAPTGSGKTLAAFLAGIDRLGRLPETASPGVRVLYISPLKALVYDIERNLRAPLEGIRAEAERMGEPFRPPTVAIRTGDSTTKERRFHAAHPSEILVTTPESLYLMLGSKVGATLRTVETIIIDEIHALAPTKRGVHLALSLERIARKCEIGDPQRIGLSATARPTKAIADFLGGDREVEIVDTSRAPRVDLKVSVPVPDMTRPQIAAPTVSRMPRPAEAPSGADALSASKMPDAADSEGPSAARSPEAESSLWPAIYPELLEGIRRHRSSIIFVNSRGLCERLAHRLNELAEEPLVRAHHGSIAHEKRREIEEALADGSLRAIVATSSLELGIDMASVELVMLVESPGAVSRGLQRIGRAGHAVGETSRGVIFPKHRGDLLEAAVVAEGMCSGAVERIEVPLNPLDVLAQQVVAIVADGPIKVEALQEILSRTASYKKLSRALFDSVLDMLAGRYPSTDFAELRPRLHWDRETDELAIREGAGRIALLSGGTIPDRGQYAVHLGTGGPRIGELDEEMVHETQAGDVITLGASSWRTLEITRDRVIVAPAPGEAGRLPFWRGDGPGRPIELGRAMGRFVRKVLGESDPKAYLQEAHTLDEFAAGNLVDYLEAQRGWTGSVPSDETIVIERFKDEVGDWRVCILTPFGARIHAPWTLAISARLSAAGDFDAQPLWTDDGILFRFADADRLPPTALFFPDPDELEELVSEQLGSSALFASQFRENAARALLLPRQRPGSRTPLWAQRLRSQNLHAVAREFPDFPIMLETYRSCMQDVFDLPGFVELMRGVQTREVAVEDVETASASPFARSLVFDYTATYLYQVDMPAAERRTQALSLDRNMLRELLGAEALRDLLDPAVIDEVEASLQGLAPELRARHADALHDRLRRVGDLDEEELAARFDVEAGSLADTRQSLLVAHRVVSVTWSGAAAGFESGPRFILAEEAALYRDALGASLPEDLPEVFLAPAASPLEQILMRYARTHGPFSTARIAERFGLLPAQIEPVLESLVARGKLISGEFDPRGEGREWCDEEVLRRVKRGTLRRLREEISPVEGDVLSRFLVDWHGVGSGRKGESRLDEVIDLLEGLPLSFAELERSILPARLPGYASRMLDERGAQGQLVWVGCRAIGEKDGRVALYRRDRIAALLDAPKNEGEDDSEFTALHHALLEWFETRGASFYTELTKGVLVPEGEDLFGALWDLVWAGRVTNDTFAPLRALGMRKPPRQRRGRPGRHALPTATAGRWSLVAPLLANPPSETEKMHARTLLYLERHGIVARDSMGLENQTGGFGAIYPVLREMEEVGRIRRGHFVAGMDGAQLAVPGAVDRLRSLKATSGEPQAIFLSALDPAQPYGLQLPWPALRNASRKPRRAVGAGVVLVDGTPCLFVDGGGERVLSFVAPGDEAQAAGAAKSERLSVEGAEARWVAALRALGASIDRLGLKRLDVREVDGASARGSDLAESFLAAGFRRGYRGFEMDRLGAGADDAR